MPGLASGGLLFRRKLLQRRAALEGVRLPLRLAEQFFEFCDPGLELRDLCGLLLNQLGEFLVGRLPFRHGGSFDRGRKNKKVSNEDWVSLTDPEARITKMKDGTTHLAYKAEHVVDLESDLILAADIRPATDGDAQMLADSVKLALQNLTAIDSGKQIEEVAADKGYRSADALELCRHLNVRTYIPEPKRSSDWTWTDKSREHERALRGNRQRMRREKGKQLQRARSELCERTFAHVCESGGMRRTWLTGLVETTKRYLMATAAHNLGCVLWKLFGVGKPRSLQGGAGVFSAAEPLWARSWRLIQSMAGSVSAARRTASAGLSRPAAAAALAG